MQGNATPARFTGRHMAMIMVGFFGVVVAVNITMARLASSTFGGTVVDNSYVASQKFNGWLASARSQQQLGWTTPLGLDGNRHVVVGLPGDGFTATGTASHPLGRAADVPLHFRIEHTGGAPRLVSTAPLPGGRWQVRIEVRRGTAAKRLLDVLA